MTLEFIFSEKIANFLNKHEKYNLFFQLTAIKTLGQINWGCGFTPTKNHPLAKDKDYFTVYAPNANDSINDAIMRFEESL